MTRRTRRRRLGIAAALLLALAVAIPFVRADRYRGAIRAQLERGLERRVDITGPVRLRWFPRPGFAVDGVVIHDDPAFGLEPLAYVSSLDAGLSFAALLRGRMEFSGLRLVRPSVNLSRNAAGRWNIPPLLGDTLGGRLPPPRIQARSARLNFKSGHLKSVFYLSRVDLDVNPDRGAAPALAFRFSGEPSRTDRAAQGLGRLSGNGRLEFPPGAEQNIRIVVRLERSSIPEILTLLRGHDRNLTGFAAARAELEGPLSAVNVRGGLELFLDDSDWQCRYTGSLHLHGPPRLRFSSFEITAPPALYTGSGEVDSSGRFTLNLVRDTATYNVSGTLEPFALQIRQPPPPPTPDSEPRSSAPGAYPSDPAGVTRRLR